MLRSAAVPPSLLRSLREHWVLLVFCAAVQILLGLVAARSYLALHNTLHNNGRWETTKVALDRGLLGAYAFLTERQTLAHGHLNLGAWHGFNEVVYRRPVSPPATIEFDFLLQRGAYLTAFFDRLEGEGYRGVRFSIRRRYPNAFLSVDRQGRFLERQLLDFTALRQDTWHRARIDLAASEVSVRLDGELVGTFPRELSGEVGYGFRGSFKNAFVDNVQLTEGGRVVFTDSFDRPGGARGLVVATIAGILGLNLLIFALLRRFAPIDGAQLGLYFGMINLTLLLLAVPLYLFVLLRAPQYPLADETLEAKEAYFWKGASDRVRAEIRERYRGPATDDRLRILFLGSSQTWGAGARHDEEVFVTVLEELLDNDPAIGRPVECVNAGISSTRARQLLRLYKREWLALEPDVVVINLSSNDSDAERFHDHLREILELSIAAGIHPVLVQEANAPEVESRIGGRHRVMTHLGEELGVPVIPASWHLKQRDDEGFLWWDKVHLTSFGQRLLAEILHRELRCLDGIGVCEEPAPG